MLCVRLLGAKQGRRPTCRWQQESLPVVLAGTSVFLAFLTGCAVVLFSSYSSHTFCGASQCLSARDIHSPYGSRAAMSRVSDSLCGGPNMKRPYDSVSNWQGCASPDLGLSRPVTSSWSLDRQAADAPLPTHSSYIVVPCFIICQHL